MVTMAQSAANYYHRNLHLHNRPTWTEYCTNIVLHMHARNMECIEYLIFNIIFQTQILNDQLTIYTRICINVLFEFTLKKYIYEKREREKGMPEKDFIFFNQNVTFLQLQGASPLIPTIWGKGQAPLPNPPSPCIFILVPLTTLNYTYVFQNST